MPLNYKNYPGMKIEEAILMLAKHAGNKRECRNTKPVVLHCCRVGMALLRDGYSEEVVIAGLLHDLLEDTDCKISSIKKKFGVKVANLVLALTKEDGTKDDFKERWERSTFRIIKAGKMAMIIKVYDGFDNLPFVSLIEDKERFNHVLWKHGLFIKEFKKEVGDLDVYREYAREHRKIILEKNTRM